MNDIDIEEGRRLAEAADDGPTAGPWTYEPWIWKGTPLSFLVRCGDGGSDFIQPGTETDALLIVWLRNNAAAMFDAIETGRQWETIARRAQADAERLTTSLDIFFDQAKGTSGPERGRLAHALLRDFRRILARWRNGDVKRHCVRGRDDGWWQCVDCDEAFPTWPDDFVPCPGKQS